MTPAGTLEGAGTPLAVAEEVRVRRAGRTVLEDASLGLHPGRITLLIGPNGAGKTTLMRAFAGSLAVAGGRIRVLGGDPHRSREARRHLAIVPQEIALYPRLTVRENIEVFAQLGGAKGVAALARHVMARTVLTAVADRLVATLSGGMQRRTNIACALVTHPRLLLLDEPMAGLDLPARREIAVLLRQLAREAGMALLLSTHDFDEGESIADEVAVLKDGRLIATGRPDALIARMFASEKRIDLVLAAPPDPATRARLLAHRFASLGDGSLWRGFRPSGAAEPLEQDGAFGLGHELLREMRIRNPGLEDVFTLLMKGAT